MPNIVNRMVVSELTQEFNDAEGMVLVSFGGLSVEETEELRGTLAEKEVRFRMVRNNLAKRVFAEQGYEFPEDTLIGNTGVAYGSTEATLGAAKVFADPKVKKGGTGTGRAVVNCTSVLDHLFIELDWSLTTDAAAASASRIASPPRANSRALSNAPETVVPTRTSRSRRIIDRKRSAAIDSPMPYALTVAVKTRSRSPGSDATISVSSIGSISLGGPGNA